MSETYSDLHSALTALDETLIARERLARLHQEHYEATQKVQAEIVAAGDKIAALTERLRPLAGRLSPDEVVEVAGVVFGLNQAGQIVPLRRRFFSDLINEIEADATTTPPPVAEAVTERYPDGDEADVDQLDGLDRELKEQLSLGVKIVGPPMTVSPELEGIDRSIASTVALRIGSPEPRRQWDAETRLFTKGSYHAQDRSDPVTMRKV